jgi:polysaccharide chain length determinant protein (PEP-CTERM system associated)
MAHPMNESGGLATILELADRLLRSWWTVVAGVCLGAAGAMLALHYLPKTYEATTKILVAPPKIPQEFVRSTINDDMSVRIAGLKAAVLSRPYMLTLIDNTYGHQRSDIDTERLIQRIQGNVDVTVESFSSSGSGMFSLKFRDNNAARAANVVNGLADLYIAENSKYRSGRARETTRTIEQLAAEAREQLDKKEKEIAEFRSQHLYELPERLEANLRLLEARQRDLDANQKSLESAQDRLQQLEAQRGAGNAWNAAGAPTVVGLDPYSTRLAQLQRELAAVRARYYDDHPEVKAKERELRDFIASGAGKPNADDASAGPKDSAVKPPPSPLEREIQNQTREVARIQEEQKRIRADIALYSARIEAAPQVQQQLSERTKGYDVLQAQYRDYQMKTETAKGSQTIEEAQKGEQFQVIERAVPSVLPVTPKPMMIMGAGLAAGLFIFAGPVLLLGFLRPTVRSEEGLRALIDVPILVSIPRIETDASKRLAMVGQFRNVLFSAVSVAVLTIVFIVMRAR